MCLPFNIICINFVSDWLLVPIIIVLVVVWRLLPRFFPKPNPNGYSDKSQQSFYKAAAAMVLIWVGWLVLDAIRVRLGF